MNYNNILRSLSDLVISGKKKKAFDHQYFAAAPTYNIFIGQI